MKTTRALLFLFIAMFVCMSASGAVRTTDENKPIYQCLAWNLEHDSNLELSVFSDRSAVLTGMQLGKPAGSVNYLAGTVVVTELTHQDLIGLGVDDSNFTKAYSYSIETPPFVWIQGYNNNKEIFKAVNALGILLKCE